MMSICTSPAAWMLGKTPAIPGPWLQARSQYRSRPQLLNGPNRVITGSSAEGAGSVKGQGAGGGLAVIAGVTNRIPDVVVRDIVATDEPVIHQQPGARDVPHHIM